MRIKDLEDGSKILDFQSPKIKDVVDLIKTINKLYEDGYTINEDFSPKHCPQIFRLIGLRFIKKEEICAETNDEVDIDSLTKKEDLLNFADDNGINIPEDIVYPASIKKYLKENIGSK